MSNNQKVELTSLTGVKKILLTNNKDGSTKIQIILDDGSKTTKVLPDKVEQKQKKAPAKAKGLEFRNLKLTKLQRTTLNEYLHNGNSRNYNRFIKNMMEEYNIRSRAVVAANLRVGAAKLLRNVGIAASMEDISKNRDKLKRLLSTDLKT